MPAANSPSKVRTRQRQLLPERGPVAVDDIREVLVIREGGTFLLTDTAGNIPPGNKRGLGLYHADTRHLSVYDFSLRNVHPVLLTSTAELGFAQEQVMTNPNMVGQGGASIDAQTIELRRVRAISSDTLEETMRVTNYNAFPVTLDLVYRFEADYADIFEVRGYQREERGDILPVRVNAASLHFSYRGKDDRLRQTDLHFEPAPLELGESHALHRITLEHLQTVTIGLQVHFKEREERANETLDGLYREVAASYSDWFADMTSMETDNELFNAVLQRSLADVRILWARTPEGMEYPAAGTPWFDALFGRDSIITALQMVAFRPDIARSVLLALASMQGAEEAPERDEEPGKILHEFRVGDMARSGALPFAPYYGSIDSTALFLILAGEYFRWTNDLGLMRELEGNLRAGLRWMEDYGDPNGRGWLAYEKRSERGLVNQGWKDSHDSIFHRDGSPLEAPIALCEVQGYKYEALLEMSRVFLALGHSALSGELVLAAGTLRRRFNRAFWLAGDNFFAIALDGKGRPAGSISSNPGHALWTQIVSRRHASAVAERVVGEQMYSGWGIRTLSNQSTRFNPYGYHLGTVWPHDNALIAAGLKKYGFVKAANQVFGGLFEAAQSFDYFRLPELFGGSTRAPQQKPVHYPVACRPQAWAAGSLPMMLTHALGLCPDASRRCLTIVRSTLPGWLKEVSIRNLRVGDATIGIDFLRRGARTTWNVIELDGQLDVVKAAAWPQT